LPIPPAPAAGTNYNTTEYQSSNGVVATNPITAYNSGASGRGVLIGIVDSGIDLNSPEFGSPGFGSRISTASRDVVSGRPLQDANGHGTYVAAVAAASRNDSGVQGVAYNAALLIARTDNSCPDPNSGCNHYDNDISAGVELATSAGARIINISLGGSAPNARLTRAIYTATAAGIIVVFSAGNNFDNANAVLRAAAVNPDPFPRTLMQDSTQARGLIVAAGAINPATDTITAFSNRAGDQQQFYITAPGQSISTRGLNGNLVSVSGTSFSAPHVAGALALLLENFPNLTGAQAVDLLLRSARDAGTTGTDAVYGRGILDIGRAFAPQGGTSIATTNGQSSTAVALDAPTIKLGSAFGGAQALRDALSSVTIQDGYNRAFTVDLGRNVQAITANVNLAATLRANFDTHIASTTAAGHTQLSFNAQGARHYIYEEGKPLASRLSPPTADVRVLGQMQLGEQLSFGFAQGYGVDVLANTPARAQSGLFLASPDFASHTAGAGAALTWQHGHTLWRFATGTAHAEGFGRGGRADILSAVVAATRATGAVHVTAAITFERETGSVLGLSSQDGLGLGRGAQTLRSALGMRYGFGRSWQLSGSMELGQSRIDGTGNALVQSVDGLATSQWHIALQKSGLLGGDVLALQLRQPLRVEGGSASLNLPGSFSYATMRAATTRRTVSLSPEARELDVELGYHINTRVLGDMQLNLFRRINPGHSASTADDNGAAVQWQWPF
jgi:subtilisin family serine protease